MGLPLEPLARAGMACNLVLAGAELAVAEADGACAQLLGFEPHALSGLGAARVLEGASRLASAKRGACEVLSVATARPLLAFWARTGERVALLLLDAALLPQRRADGSFDFAGAAAHDLRNPLATVKLNLQVLARQLPDEDERSHKRLSIALREVETLESGLEELSECGRGPAAVAVRADLSRALGAVLQRVKSSTRVELEPGLPPAAVEESRLVVAVAGLVRLAARDGGEGEGEVMLRGRAGEPGRLRIEVCKPGFEVPTRRSLAVALAQRVAEDAGGRFFVEGDPGGPCLVLELAVSR
ncbi:MAG TPA: histidine kinase dimerization/phospho-acceptor domain-containing protein [Myxococcales bacterium]|jgi:signal transduction histidine kinase